MRTIALCLPERPEQIERARSHFDSVGIGHVDFLYGLNAEPAGLRTVHFYELDNPGYIMGPKPIGIWLGHYMVWSHIMLSAPDEDEYVMVLEIDAKFPQDWCHHLYQATQVVPKFDILFLGHCCLQATPMEQIGESRVWRSSFAQCSHCYIIRAGIVPRFVFSLRKVWAPIDIQVMLEILPSVESYAILPRLVEQFDTELSP